MTQTIFYFLIWGLLIFFMMRVGCGAHVMGHGGGHARHGGSGDRDARGGTPEEAVDPVCKMTVTPADAKTSLHDGRVYYFCSQNCREKFEAGPSSYLSATRAVASQVGGHHG